MQASGQSQYILDVLNNYQFKSVNISNLLDIYSAIVHQVAEISFVDNVAMYSLNYDTYEFGLEITSDPLTENHYSALYDEMLLGGTIGELTSNLEMITYYKSVNEAYVLIPLVSIDYITGILVFKTKVELNDSEKQIFKLWLSHKALMIENIKFKNKYLLENSRLEQSMALSVLTVNKTKMEVQEILESIQAAVLLISPSDFTILALNDYAARLICDCKENIINKKYQKYIADATRIDDDPISHRETILMTQDKTPVPIMRYTTRTMMLNTQVFVETLTDIRRYKNLEISLKHNNLNLEQRIRERTTELEETVTKLQREIEIREGVESNLRMLLDKEKDYNELRSRFVQMIYKTIKKPVFSIDELVSNLAANHSKLSTEERFKQIDAVQLNINEIMELMENVMFLYRYNLIDDVRKRDNINVKNMIDDIVGEYGKLMNNYSIFSISIELEKEHIVSEKEILSYVLRAIISNSVKFAGEKLHIGISVTESEDAIIFTIKDNGIGIPEADVPNIFEIFIRGGNAGDYRGCGLGLFTVNTVLKFLGGSIEVDSLENIGTKMIVTIPKI